MANPDSQAVVAKVKAAKYAAQFLAVYGAEGTFWRYLKIAELARQLPTQR